MVIKIEKMNLVLYFKEYVEKNNLTKSEELLVIDLYNYIFFKRIPEDAIFKE